MVFFPRGEKKLLILQTVDELKDWVQKTKRAGQTIGLVPTMGFLHEGHLSLVEKAKSENDKVS